MNCGPQAGLAEIVLPALQPGSSIMPGKINPVIRGSDDDGLRPGDRQRCWPSRSARRWATSSST